MKRFVLFAALFCLLAGLALAQDTGNTARAFNVDKSVHGVYVVYDAVDLIIGTAAETTGAFNIGHFVNFSSSYEVDMGQTCDSAVCAIYVQVSHSGIWKSDDWVDADTFTHADDDTLYQIIPWNVPTAARFIRFIKQGAQGANDSCYAAMRHVFQQ